MIDLSYPFCDLFALLFKVSHFICLSIILYVSSVKLLKVLMKFGTEVCSGSCQANCTLILCLCCTHFVEISDRI